MAERGKASFVKRQLPRAATAAVVAAKVVSPAAAQASTPSHRGHNCAPVSAKPLSEGEILRRDAIHRRAVPIAPNVGLVIPGLNGTQNEIVVPDDVATADGQVNYYVPEIPNSSRRLSAAKALQTIRFAEITGPITPVTELFASLEAPLDDPASYVLSSSSTTGVIDLNDSGRMPETTIHLSNGQDEYVNVGFVRPYVAPAPTSPVTQ